MKHFIKDFAWKVPIAIMWSVAANFPFSEFSTWGQMSALVLFYWGLDAIRWGLKKD